MPGMRRREFITLLGGAAAWPLTVRAQQAARIRRVGLLMNFSENDLEAQRLLTALREGLAQLGWADGRNLRIDYRWASGDIGRIRTFSKRAGGVVARHHRRLWNSRRRSTTARDPLHPHPVPVGHRPAGQGPCREPGASGRQQTGFSIFEISVATKWIEALQQQLAPGLKRVVTIYNPKTAPYFPLYVRAIEQAAPSFAVRADWARGS